LALLVALAILRFGLVFTAGLRFNRGDFYATLPGAHAQAVNPTLWNSPDLEDIQGKQAAYLRGPTQYVTLYPLVYLDSYATIAAVLLVGYGIVILLIAEVSYRFLRPLTDGALTRAPLLIATLLYFPLLQGWLGREFELVITLAVACAYWATVHDKRGTLGALLAYVSLYKYLPFLSVPYLLVRRWWSSVTAFLATTAVLLVAAQWLVGLEGFVKNHIPGMAMGLITTLTSTKAFCDGPVKLLRFFEFGQEVSVRTALCSSSQWSGIPPATAYLALVGIVLSASIYGTWRLERAAELPAATERWRRVWELSLVVVVSTTFFYGHYYYLGVLILPLNALMVRFSNRPTRSWPRLSLWGLAYLLLAAFLLPPTYVSRAIGIDVWKLYFTYNVYFPGELILLGLILHQYATLPVGPPITDRAWAPNAASRRPAPGYGGRP
jgi:hypothetical protein